MNAEHHKQPDVVQPVARKGELAADGREDAVRADQQRSVEGATVGEGDSHTIGEGSIGRGAGVLPPLRVVDPAREALQLGAPPNGPWP